MNITLRFSQLNGWIQDLMKSIGNFFMNLVAMVWGNIIIWIYQIFIVPLALVIDAIQLMFRKFAGLDNYLYEGELQSGDVVLSLINSETVQNVFWSLVILAVVLLIITTIVALIRAQTQSMDDKSRRTNNQIFASALKALVNFFMVPVVAILGIFMSNALLKSLDQATTGESNLRVSSMLFVSCAYECNRARSDTAFAENLALNYINNMGVLKGTTENIADVVDQAFKNGTTFGGDAGIAFNYDDARLGVPTSFFNETNNIYLYILKNNSPKVTRTSFSIYDAYQVFYYYDLTSFNYIFFIFSSLFALWVLLTTSIGLIKRMFKLVILLVISPPIAALMPLDNGGALAKWRKEFIGSVLSAYATVVTFNIMMMLLGPILEIDFFYFAEKNVVTNMLGTMLNMIVQVLILCGALLFFKDFTKTISQIIGAEDAHDAGVGATKALASKVAMAATAGAATVGAAKAKLTAGKLKKRGEGLQKNADDADSAVRAAEKDAEKGKISAADLEKIKDKQTAAHNELKKNNDAMNDYNDLAKSKLHMAKNNTLSVATNGLADGFTKGDDALKDIEDKKLHGGARELAKKVNPNLAIKAYRGVKGIPGKFRARSAQLDAVRATARDYGKYELRDRNKEIEDRLKGDVSLEERERLEKQLQHNKEALKWQSKNPLHWGYHIRGGVNILARNLARKTGDIAQKVYYSKPGIVIREPVNAVKDAVNEAKIGNAAREMKARAKDAEKASKRRRKHAEKQVKEANKALQNKLDKGQSGR